MRTLSEHNIVEVVLTIIKTSLWNIFSEPQYGHIKVSPADHVTSICNVISVCPDTHIELIVPRDELDPIHGFEMEAFPV